MERHAQCIWISYFPVESRNLNWCPNYSMLFKKQKNGENERGEKGSSGKPIKNICTGTPLVRETSVSLDLPLLMACD